jgi:hypothetical protein
MKNSNDTIGNRTRDLPVLSAVPQPTAPPRPRIVEVVVYIWVLKTLDVDFLLVWKEVGECNLYIKNGGI